MTAQVRQLRQPHTTVVMPEYDRLFGHTFRPICSESDCYRGPFVSSESRAREIGLEHTCKALGTWRPAW